MTDERFEDLEHVHCGKTDKQLARARSVEHSRGTSDSTTSDTAKFAGPLLRVRVPHTPLIREAPLFAGRTASSGTYGVVLTIHVDDVDEAYKRAKRLGAEIAAEIRNEEYGQRRFLLVDPNGLVLNVMSII